jgi:uncharacterized protein (PEP-CTERM system associated)
MIPPRGRGTAPALAAAACWLAAATGAAPGRAWAQVPSAPAPIDTLLPRAGLEPTDQDPAQALQAAYGEAPPQPENAPAWRIAPQVSLGEILTDNAFATPDRRGDAITVIQPGVTVQGDTPRLRVSLDAEPALEIYAVNSDQTRIAGSLGGSAQLVLVPDWLFLDTRAAIAQTSEYGTQAATATLGSDDRSTVSSEAVTPFIDHRFGGLARLQAGYTAAYSADNASQQTALSLGQGGFNGSTALPGNYGSTWLLTNRGFATLSTGEDFGRLRDALSIDASAYQGSGVLRSAHRTLATDDLAYALTRRIALLVQGGYEDLRYSGQPGFAYRGGVWAGGLRWTPGPTTTVTVEYRHLDGFGSLFVQGSIALTPRLRLSGGYSEAISTTAQDLQTTLLDENPDRLASQNEPLLAPLIFGSSAFGQQTDLFRVRRLDVTATLLGARDTIAVTLGREKDTLVASASPATAVDNDSGWTAGIDWTHDLARDWSLRVFAGYTTRQPTGAGGLNEDTASGGIVLQHRFTPTLTGYAGYAGAFRNSDFAGRNADQNQIAFGLRKEF